MSKEKFTQEDLPQKSFDSCVAEYISKNLKMDIGSKKITQYDSKYEITLKLILDGNPFSAVSFTI